MSESNVDEESDPSEINDPESYVNHRRLKAIFDIRDSIHEQRTKLQVSRHDKNLSRYQMLSGYRALTSSYIVEVEPILRRFDGGSQLLNKSDFGETVITPKVGQQFNSGTMSESTMLDTSQNPDIDTDAVSVSHRYNDDKEEVYQHTGLLSLLNHPDPLVGEWEITTKRHNGYKTITHRNPTQIDFRTLDSMVRTVNNFLADIGFEVSPNEDQDNLHLSV